MDEQTDLIVPVYLNQRIVFDLVAMSQRGISTVTRVSETQREAGISERQVGAAFGLSKAFASLLKIGLDVKHTRSGSEEAGRISTEDRVHTPASLFFVLRNLLIERNALEGDREDLKVLPGAFVEFTAG